jgi:hypothetical protein
MSRRVFSRRQFLAAGHTDEELEWGVGRRWVRLVYGWYAEGREPPTPSLMALGRMLAADGEASGLVAGKFLGLDSIEIPSDDIPRRRRGAISPELVLVNGIRCTNGLQTIVDIAPFVDDLVWEQALESALRKDLFKLEELASVVPLLTKSRTAGSPRIKRVLALRPAGAPPTESLLETLMVQLARRTPGVPEPTRQVVVDDEDGRFVARVDLAWPELGGFNELDGERHKDQPVYDAVRQTNVVTATGWLPGRFSWTEVRLNPVPTARRLAKFIDTARRRRIA